MPFFRTFNALAPSMLISAFAFAQNPIKELKYPTEVVEVEIKTTVDAQIQKALWFAPKEIVPRPLLVALHTWSSDYSQAGGEALYAQWCLQERWVFIHPNFRGRNRTPQACGSDLVVSDVLDAVEFAKSNAKVDASRIYLIGVSGGGHASMLLAARAPETWAGVSAWCGISDLSAWHHQCKGTQHDRYAKEMESVCGGPPDGPLAKVQFKRRSPLTHLQEQALRVNLDLNHGVSDGRTGSVPFTHSLHAFNAIAAEEDQLRDQEISDFYETQQSPERQHREQMRQWDSRQPIIRRTSRNARVTIFQGGHEIVHEAALNWLAHQRKGQNATWNLDPENIRELEHDNLRVESGK